MAKDRMPEFDIAKLIALCAVIVGHTAFAGVPQSLVDFCYSFDMPLFFIVSGYFCRQERLTPEYVKKNVRSLLFPYCLTAALVIVFMTLRALFLNENVIDAFITWIIAAAYGSGGVYPGMPSGVVAIGAIWYLLALFWAKLLLASANETKSPIVVVVLLFITGISTRDYVWLPLSVQPALCAVLFLYVGARIRELKLLDDGEIPPLLWVCVVATWLYCGAFFGQLYMVGNVYAHGFIDVIGGIAGSLSIIRLSRLIAVHLRRVGTIIAWMGKNTLPLFCMHLVSLNVIRWDVILAWEARLFPEFPLWIITLFVQFGLSAALTLFLYLSPRLVSGVYFASKRVGHY